MYNKITPNTVINLGKFLCLYEMERLKNQSNQAMKSKIPIIVDCYKQEIAKYVSVKEKVDKSVVSSTTMLFCIPRIQSSTCLNNVSSTNLVLK